MTIFNSIRFDSLSKNSNCSGSPTRCLRQTGLIAGLIMSLAGSSQGAIHVTTTAASSATECTLADAIETAKTGSGVGVCQWDSDSTIVLEEATYETSGQLPFVIESGDSVSITGVDGTTAATIKRRATDPEQRFFKVKGGTLELSNVTLSGGDLDFSGGAIKVFAAATLNLDTCRFHRNSAAYRGGAIYNVGMLNVNECTFDGNSAADGGAIYVAGGGSQAIIKESQFLDNHATNGGGAISSSGTLDVKHATIEGNSANQGGAIDVVNGTADVFFSTLVDNVAVWGGAILVDSAASDLQLENSTLSSNAASQGGALSVVTGSASVDMCTFKDNRAQTLGSAIHTGTGTVTLARSALDRDPVAHLCDSDPACSPVPLCNGPVASIVSGGYNAAEDDTCDHQSSLGDQAVSSLYLSDLVDHHGSYTPVHVPLCAPGQGACVSPLMEQYACSTGTFARDQRDQFNRYTHANGIWTGQLCDVGAYETVYTWSTSRDTSIELQLNGYQISQSSHLLAREILDNGGGQIHQISFPQAPDPEADDCRIDWEAPIEGTLYIRDIIFVADGCAHDCFEDPALCAAECEGSDPAGWTPDDAGESTAADTTYGFDIPCDTDTSTDDLPTVVVEYYHRDDEAALQQGDTSVLRHWDPLNPEEECTGPGC